MNVCSYHLQEAGATPVQELAYALVTACRPRRRQGSGRGAQEDLGAVVERISFFVNAGIRFVDEICKMRAFVRLWDELTATLRRHRREAAPLPLRRAGQLAGPHRAAAREQHHRIMLEMLAVTLSKDARARAVQLPAWNEALGLPRPWDQQWSLRMQQILAFESDLLEHGDIFDGSQVVERGGRARRPPQAGDDAHPGPGGAVAAVDFMKRALVESNARACGKIESGEQVVIGLNASPRRRPRRCTEQRDRGRRPGIEAAADREPRGLAQARDAKAVEAALAELRRAAKAGRNVMPPSIAAPRPASPPASGPRCATRSASTARPPASAAPGRHRRGSREGRGRGRARLGEKLGRRPLLVGKPGLDGHSNGAEQIALKARDGGFEVIYEGIRVTPEQIVAPRSKRTCTSSACPSCGSHLELVPEVLSGCARRHRPRAGGRGRHHPARTPPR